MINLDDIYDYTSMVEEEIFKLLRQVPNDTALKKDLYNFQNKLKEALLILDSIVGRYDEVNVDPKYLP